MHWPILAVTSQPQFDLAVFLAFLFQPNGAFIGAVALTVYVAIIAQSVGSVLGVLSALAGLSRNRLLRTISSIYVWFFRGTPLLVQLVLVYFGTPYLLGVDLFPANENIGFISLRGAVVAGIVAFSLNEGAYMSEIVRAGIQSVDKGQAEAAKSLGMTYRLTMTRIVLPQALRVIIPPLGNEFNNMLKTTSLLTIIAVQEMLRVAQGQASSTFKYFEIYFGVALYYLLLTTIWTLIQGRIERRLGVSDARASADKGFLARLTGLRSPGCRSGRAMSGAILDAIGGAPDVATDQVVVATDVEKSFGKLEVLKKVSLTVTRREVVVVIGPSGSGKTTFIRCINHLEKIQAGRILVNGHLIGYREVDGKLVEDREQNIARQRQDIGMVFQRFNLFPHMTALDNIREAPIRVRKIPRRRPRKPHRHCSRGSGSRTRPTSIRASCRAASSSASPSPERLR